MGRSGSLNHDEKREVQNEDVGKIQEESCAGRDGKSSSWLQRQETESLTMQILESSKPLLVDVALDESSSAQMKQLPQERLQQISSSNGM